MSDEGERERSRLETQQHRLRLVGYGIVVAGLLTLLVAAISTKPQAILVFGLGGLAVLLLVVEQIQGAGVGLSLGLLTGSFGTWIWPNIEGESYVVLGSLLVVVGVTNAWLTPQFHRLGARLAGDAADDRE
jgi:hypothetical protein